MKFLIDVFVKLWFSFIKLLVKIRFPVRTIRRSAMRLINDGYVRIYEYQYVPKHRDSLKKSKIGAIMEDWYTNNRADILERIQKFCLFKEQFCKIPFEQDSSMGIKWNNGYIPPLDGISIYGFLADLNPRYYVEVGSGNTTLFASASIKDNNLRTKIISIDPFPRREIDELCDTVYRVPLENMDLEFFECLSNEDVLLIDNSHRAFQNSDVTVFFTEILPRLPPGIVYAIHDIYLPEDYPDGRPSTAKKWYNEQYLLCAYLLGGVGSYKVPLHVFK